MTTSRPRSAPRNGPLVTLPYTVELNDIPMMLVQHHESEYFTTALHRHASTGSTRRARTAPRSWRSRSTPTSRASRTGSNTSKPSTTTSPATPACCTGTGSRSSTGIRREGRLSTQSDHAADRAPRLFRRSPSAGSSALPGGARLAVWVIVNVEEWDINETMPRTVLTPPAGGSPMPDIPNWAWHEYGNRVGFWRMLEVFDDLRIPRRAGDQRLGDRPLRRRSSRPRSSATGNSSATASPRRTCRRSPTSATTSAKTAAAIRDVDRQEPARLARPRPDRDLGDARPPRRGRLRLCLRLGARRPAGGAEDPRPGRSSTCPTRRNATTSR